MQIMMKKIYMTPKTEIAIHTLTASILAGSPNQPGIGSDQNDNGGGLAKENHGWWFEEEESLDEAKHFSAWDSFRY